MRVVDGLCLPRISGVLRKLRELYRVRLLLGPYPRNPTILACDVEMDTGEYGQSWGTYQRGELTSQCMLSKGLAASSFTTTTICTMVHAVG